MAVITLGGILKGKVKTGASKIRIPFNTGNSKFSKRIPRFAHLVFEARQLPNKKIEFTFSGVDAKCSCNECINGKVRRKHIK